jgi:primosomal protein N'
VLSRASAVLRGLLLKSFPVSCVLGPETPPISRVSLMYVERLLLKLEMNRPNEKMKDAVREAVDELRKRREFQQVSVSFDVDPM